VRRLAIVLTTLAALSSAPARAQVIAEPAPPPFPNPKKFARGFFASGELGALVYLGNATKYAGAGINFGVRLGYDLTRWLALQAHVAGASNDATLPAPTVGQSVQTFLYAGELRAQLQIRRVALSLEGGAGITQLSNNVLDQVGISQGGNLISLAIIGGAGVDYHTLNRHFSVGVIADYIWMQGFNSTHAMTATAYLRYTH
jgi:hypothetical protein